MLDRGEIYGGAALYGGSLTACSAAPAVAHAADSGQSMVLIAFSALGAISAVTGLAYTVWNGNRNYKLAQEQAALRRLELTRG